MASCVLHPALRGDARCRRCEEPFCLDCVVRPFGPDKPPMCVACALKAAGVRSRGRRR